MNQQREEMQQQVIKSQMIFGGIAAVSLFVAAINIINTMTMAIYERTREIGVMKVLGCELGSIRTMFLLESSTIGFIGGLIGVAFSLLASFVLNNLSTILAAFGQGGGLDLSGLMGGRVLLRWTGAAGAAIRSSRPGSCWQRWYSPRWWAGSRYPARKQGGQDQCAGSHPARLSAYILYKEPSSPGKRDRLGFLSPFPHRRAAGCRHSLMGRSVGRGLDPSVDVYGRHRACRTAER